MSTDDTNETTPTEGRTLAQLSLLHLDREDAGLRHTLDAVRQLRAALVAGDQGGLAEALRRQEELAAEANLLLQGREELQRQAGADLGLAPEAVTLGVLAERLPAEEGRRLAEGRARLRQLAAEVQQLNERNAALTYHCLDFLQRFFRQLTGGPGGGRYGRAGTYHDSICGSLIEARG